MSELDISQQLEAPLSLLKSLLERAFRPGQIPSQAQLQGHLSHLQGAVDDVVGVAATALSDLVERIDAELERIDPGLQEARQELGEVMEELNEQMMTLADAFASATSLEDLAAARQEVDGVELAMQGTLGRLEAILEILGEDQDESGVCASARLEEASAVLELLGGAAESVEGHLSDGQVSHLEEALARVEQAAAVLRQTLSSPHEA